MGWLFGHVRGVAKAGGAAGFGLVSGAALMYGQAAVDKVIKPVRPVANFAATADGLTVTCANHAAGDSGWWDFGDGTPLEPFEADKPASHTYAKPGLYAVKLTVRNFLMDENERTVPLDLSAPATPAAAPRVALSVEPVNPRSVAPATFRVRGDVQHAERALLDLGDRVEVRTEGGPFETLVVFDKPGEFPVQLIAQSGKQAVKQAARVTVQPDAAGGLAAVVRVSDSGTRRTPAEWQEMVPVPHAKDAKGFTKDVPARPGHLLTTAKVVGGGKGLKGVTATVAADRRSVRLAGEWAEHAAEAQVALAVTGERVTSVGLPAQTVAVSLAGGPVSVPLPPAPKLDGLTRRVAVELRAVGPDGRAAVVAGTPDLKQGWTQPTADGRVIRAELAGDAVRVSVGK